MSPVATSSIVFAWTITGAAGGRWLRTVLPEDHLNSDSRDVMKLVTGIVGTILALVLGLLVSSSRTFFETQSGELQQLSAQVILLDRVLAFYGAEAKDTREFLRESIARLLEQLSANKRTGTSALDPSAGSDSIFEAIQHLSPRDESQRALRSQALAIVTDLGRTRWLMYEQTVSQMPAALLIVIGFWLSMMFFSFGVLAPRHPTMLAYLVLGAFCVSAAIFVILEMYNPYGGLIRISSAPIKAALDHLGK